MAATSTGTTSTGKIALAALVIGVVGLGLAATNFAMTFTSSRAKSFTVEARNFTFAPSTMTVKVGDIVRLTLKNVANVTHELLIVEDKDAAITTEHGGGSAELPFGFEIEAVGAGQEKSISFTAPKSGTFSYVCLEDVLTAPDFHAEHGMVGTFTVEP